MKIRVNDITEKEKVIEIQEPVSHYPSLQQAQDAGECKFLRPVDISLSLVREYGHIRVRGSVATEVGLNCSRCLADYKADIQSNFTIYFTKSSGEQVEDEVELAEEDLLSVSYQGDEIDLSNEVAEQVLLEIPYKPLCNEDCLGLCSVCGEDLNSSACSCKDSTSTMAFSSLRGFKVNK